MIRRYLRYARLGVRLLLPGAAERRYARAVRACGLFDRDWYRACNPRLPWLCRRLPERHYVLVGEAAGLCPGPGFSPRAYAHLNPDQAGSGLPPLAHYLARGRAEGRAVQDLPAGDAAPALPRIRLPQGGLQSLPQGGPQSLPQGGPQSLPQGGPQSQPQGGPQSLPQGGPQSRPQSRHPSPPRIAIVLHLYYREMWDEMAALIARQSFAFDLFVTLTEDRKAATGHGRDAGPLPRGGLPDTSPPTLLPDAAIRARIAEAFPQARVWTLPNHGRDILPFLHLAQSGVLAPYAAVCKLHTKKSPHRDDGDRWRQALLAGVLAAPDRTAARLAAFLADAQAGVWVAEGHRLSGPQWWGPNQPRATALLARVGLVPGPADPVFAAGSIQWISAALLARLAALPVTAGDFETEKGQVDGTTAHALERVFGIVAQRSGARIVTAPELDRPGS